MVGTGDFRGAEWLFFLGNFVLSAKIIVSRQIEFEQRSAIIGLIVIAFAGLTFVECYWVEGKKNATLSAVNSTNALPISVPSTPGGQVPAAERTPVGEPINSLPIPVSRTGVTKPPRKILKIDPIGDLHLSDISDQKLKYEDIDAIKTLWALFGPFDQQDNTLQARQDMDQMQAPKIQTEIVCNRIGLRKKIFNDNKALFSRAGAMRDESAKRPALSKESEELKTVLAKFFDTADWGKGSKC